MPITLQLVRGNAWQIYAICDADGGTFLDQLELSESEGNKIAANLDRLAAGGAAYFPSERMHIVDNAARLFQLRINDCRIMWFYDEGRVIVCCHGYRKKSQKIPPGDRAKGKAALAAYFEAKQHGQITIRKEEE